MAAAVALTCLLSGCGGDDNVVETCDEMQRYQAAKLNPRVQAPEGLDDLEQYKEMPIPEATNDAPRAAGSRCIDLPPNTLGTN
jgi:uncharacterized lipoprotein